MGSASLAPQHCIDRACSACPFSQALPRYGSKLKGAQSASILLYCRSTAHFNLVQARIRTSLNEHNLSCNQSFTEVNCHVSTFVRSDLENPDLEKQSGHMTVSSLTCALTRLPSQSLDHEYDHTRSCWHSPHRGRTSVISDWSHHNPRPSALCSRYADVIR